MPSLFKEMNPAGVAATWSQACDFWRTTATICPATLDLGQPSTAGSSFAISGGWLSGDISLVAATCGGSDAYVTTAGTSLLIDVWKALADALWSSSVAFTVKAHRTISAGNLSLTAKPRSTTNPAADTLTVAVPLAAGCPTNVFGTLTVFDDGTFTFA